MQKITPFLWFDRQAEEAAAFYVSVFSGRGGKQSRVGDVTRYGKEGFEVHKMPEGTAMTVNFELEGQQFIALNGGPVFTFNEAISFQVLCETQEEVDYYWKKLSADPEAEQCGWLKDKYGVSWQIVPALLHDMLASSDAQQAERVTQVFLKMKKFDVATLKQAYEGR